MCALLQTFSSKPTALCLSVKLCVSLHVQKLCVSLHVQKLCVSLHVQKLCVSLHVQKLCVSLHVQKLCVSLHVQKGSDVEMWSFHVLMRKRGLNGFPVTYP